MEETYINIPEQAVNIILAAFYNALRSLDKEQLVFSKQMEIRNCVYDLLSSLNKRQDTIFDLEFDGFNICFSNTTEHKQKPVELKIKIDKSYCSYITYIKTDKGYEQVNS